MLDFVASILPLVIEDDVFHLLFSDSDVAEAEKIFAELGDQHIRRGIGGSDFAPSHQLPRKFPEFVAGVTAAWDSQFRPETVTEVFRVPIVDLHARPVHVRDQRLAALSGGCVAATLFFGGHVLVGVQRCADYQHRFSGFEFIDEQQRAGASATGKSDAAPGFRAGWERAGD